MGGILGDIVSGTGTIGKVLGGLGGLGSLPGPVGSILSAVAGANSLFGSKDEDEQEAPRAAQEAPFNPQRPDEASRPESLSEFGTFTPEQQRSALATKGVNSGLGSEEDIYYRNLVQRSLIGDGNQVDQSNPDFLLPVESQYFSRQGVNTSDIMQFLKGISS